MTFCPARLSELLCGEDCAFCAQSRRHSADIQIYPLIKTGELLAMAAAFAGDGLDYMGIVISGGAAAETDFQKICQAACDIRAKVKIKLCASLGLLSPERAGALKAAGIIFSHSTPYEADSLEGAIWKENTRFICEEGRVKCLAEIPYMAELAHDGSGVWAGVADILRPAVALLAKSRIGALRHHRV